MEMKKVLKYAMEIGECMLVSGAGVSRVEDTISRICKAYGAKEANVFSITSSIVTTIEDEKGEILTQTKRIRSYKTDFTKLDELNQLSRYMCKELPEEEEVKRKIAEIKKGKYTRPFSTCAPSRNCRVLHPSKIPATQRPVLCGRRMPASPAAVGFPSLCLTCSRSGARP